MSKGICDVPDCNRPTRARGWCSRHYNRWSYSGSPLGGLESPSGDCPVCGSVITRRGATGPAPTYCSTSCRSRADWGRHGPRRAADKRLRRRASLPEKACAGCGVGFTPESSVSRIYCSDSCSRRVQNAARRARSRGVSTENLHWRRLLAEDGPACHICGADVDVNDFSPRPRGAIACGPAYPTLDHVVALAAGGLHERANARLAHFYCNSVKGARAITSLVG